MGSITVTALETVTGIVEIVLPGPQGPVGDIHPSMPGLVQTATDAATSATASALSADTSEANASASAATATTQATRSADWAEKTVGTVDGVGYSSKYHAQLASTSAQTATTKASEASTSATDAAASAATASTKASEASTSATNAAASATAAATSATDTANALVGERSAVATLTNKTLALGGNTITGTTAQFNTALTDGDFATLAGTETLTNKTITGGTTNPTTLQEGGVDAVIQSDIGAGPNQIPLNQHLGPLAYRDENPAGAVVGTTAVQVLSGKSFSDNVGIGTSSPTGKLHVVGSAGGTYIDAAGNQIVMTRAGTNYLISNDPASSLELRAPLYTFKSENGTTERLRIDASGNLGIGTSSPISRLHVTGDVRAAGNLILVGGAGTPEVQFFQSSRNWTIRNNAGSLEVYDSTASAVRATFNASGNLGLGVTPSAWVSSSTALQNRNASFWATGAGAYVGYNYYYDGARKYIASGFATEYSQLSGQHLWYTAPSGAAGDPISFTQAMTLSASGNLGLGVTPGAWASGNIATQIGDLAANSYVNNRYSSLAHNARYDGAWKYINSKPAVNFGLDQNIGGFTWQIAPSGTAGQPISFTQAMTLDATGLAVTGALSATDNVTTDKASGAFGFKLNSSGYGTLAQLGVVNAGTDNTTWVGSVSNNSFKIRTVNTDVATFDTSGNLGLGVVPSAWGSSAKALELSGGSVVGFGTGSLEYWYNAYHNGTSTIYKFGGTGAAQYKQTGTGHSWYIAPSGTAGDPISFTQAMDLVNSAGASTLTVNSAINTASAVRLTTNGGLTAGMFLARPTADHSLGFQTAGTERARIDSSGNLLVGKTAQSSGGKLEVAGNVVCQPSTAAPTLAVNGEMSFQLVSDTSLKILVRGSDGITRSTTLTLT